MDGLTIMKEKYDKFRQLNSLVSTRYKNIAKIIWISLCMIAQMYWIRFLQWANSNIEHIDKKTAIISYVLNGKLYKIIVHQKRGPGSVAFVIDENQEDVSDMVIPFLGPNDDWHKTEFNPNFWKKKTLTFFLASEEEKTFDSEEHIVLE
jgi:hypothetical protein